MNQPDQRFSSIQLQLLQQLAITPLQIGSAQPLATTAELAAVPAASSLPVAAKIAPVAAQTIHWQSADPAQLLVQDVLHALQYLGFTAHWQFQQETDSQQLSRTGLQSGPPDRFSSAQAKKALWQWLCAQESQT